MRQFYAPLDPECEVVRRYEDALFNDPMTSAMGAPTDEIMAAFERKHRAKCKRCQQFGAANIEVR